MVSCRCGPGRSSCRGMTSTTRCRMRAALSQAITRGVNVANLGANAAFRRITFTDSTRRAWDIDRYTAGFDSTIWRYLGDAYASQPLLGAEYFCADVGHTLTTGSGWLFQGIAAGTAVPGFLAGEVDFVWPGLYKHPGLSIVASGTGICRTNGSRDADARDGLHRAVGCPGVQRLDLRLRLLPGTPLPVQLEHPRTVGGLTAGRDDHGQQHHRLGRPRDDPAAGGHGRAMRAPSPSSESPSTPKGDQSFSATSVRTARVAVTSGWSARLARTAAYTRRVGTGSGSGRMTARVGGVRRDAGRARPRRRLRPAPRLLGSRRTDGRRAAGNRPARRRVVRRPGSDCRVRSSPSRARPGLQPTQPQPSSMSLAVDLVREARPYVDVFRREARQPRTGCQEAGGPSLNRRPANRAH